MAGKSGNDFPQSSNDHDGDSNAADGNLQERERHDNGYVGWIIRRQFWGRLL